ncbi:archaetidylserine decarboxylase [Paenalcaligenes faecalis]|uniref:archaetidylserine decarboxylase n=1 Tax=Paenalcaligenes faecalis TaxID=2980099 RepID=UPI0022B9B2A7|nr:archaetidylserine decarboxylase [Paenalcaligenes faecalis]
MSDQLFIFFQKVMPKRLLTELLGKLARTKGGSLTTSFIEYFIKRYGVNMAEAIEKDPAFYDTFNAFFTREIRPELRPIADFDLVSPVDGAVSQLGKINIDQIFQAKGKSFTTNALIGGDSVLAEQFADGLFATLYLSPKDYHRIHMPCDGYLRKMVYVPGNLYSVNPLTARSIDRLFARNERVVCVFDGEHGPFVMVLVGATVVGSIKTQWHGAVNSPRPTGLQTWQYNGDLLLKKGEEMGQFLLGSTVVMLFPDVGYQFLDDWKPEASIRMGQAMGKKV